jgi:hypothetical protein
MGHLPIFERWREMGKLTAAEEGELPKTVRLF